MRIDLRGAAADRDVVSNQQGSGAVGKVVAHHTNPVADVYPTGEADIDQVASAVKRVEVSNSAASANHELIDVDHNVEVTDRDLISKDD